MSIKSEINDLLISTRREGIANLINYMQENGFFTAPCSSQYHLCKEGGLAEHSLNVLKVAVKLDRALKPNITTESLIIVTLLHDLGKMGINHQAHYKPNYLKNGELSTSKPYVVNEELLGIPHELLSIQIASKFIELTIPEQQAILFHNGLYTATGNFVKGKESELYLLLHMADMYASRVIEKE